MIVMSFAQVSTYERAVYPSLTDLPVIIPLLVGVTCGVLAGMINGCLIAYTRIPPFIATLGLMVSARGLAKWYTKGQPVSFPIDSFAAIGEGMNPVYIFLVISVLFHFIMKYTLYGKHTYAIGSNEQAARITGINVERHKILVYTIAGVLAAFAAQAGMGVMYELDAIAMTVIGGTSLTGGRGSIIGTMIGMLIFGVIISGFTFLSLDAYYQEMTKGAIIVGAVIADVYRQKRQKLSQEKKILNPAPGK
ncbi:hypothetical protein CHS0354_035197 [Potamilus streckersoni]|uniref:ABC transporter n=1 Tax=Potamilus streckersoni TaxID=2493646 RepID=A0AAE0S2F0_9BIVA|nr:hypothetical protein CHS0354_035197 [Potamilus streckersoni]